MALSENLTESQLAGASGSKVFRHRLRYISPACHVSALPDALLRPESSQVKAAFTKMQDRADAAGTYSFYEGHRLFFVRCRPAFEGIESLLLAPLQAIIQACAASRAITEKSDSARSGSSATPALPRGPEFSRTPYRHWLWAIPSFATTWEPGNYVFE